MFNNIGQKLKLLAYLQVILGIICGVIISIELSILNLAIYGLIFLLFSPLLSLFAAWITYGIGTAAENSESIRYHLTYNLKQNETKPIFHDDSQTKTTSAPSNPTPPLESTTVISTNINDNEYKSALTVGVNDHNECFCPKCHVSLSFDNLWGIKKCKKCHTLLKLVKKQYPF